MSESPNNDATDESNTVGSIHAIDEGDELTIVRKGELIADAVEVTNVGSEGFSGVPKPETDGDITWGTDLFGVLCDALPDNSELSDNFEVYEVSNDE